MPARANVAETSSAASVAPGPSDAGSCPEGSIVSDRTDSPKSVTLGSPSGGQEDVARLEVEVEHARVAGVGVMDRPGHPFHDHGRRARVGLVGLDPIGDGPPFDELHDEEPAAAVLAEVERPDDVGVLHPGDRAGVRPEPVDRGQVARGRPRSVFNATTISRECWGLAFQTTPWPPSPSFSSRT